MRRQYYFLSLVALTLFVSGCNKPTRYDLIVENAILINDNGEFVSGRTILIKGDTIAGIIDAGEPVRTRKVVDADGRLVLPGFIDGHTSIGYFFRSQGKAFDNHPKNLTTFYRSMMSKHFLPFGVTTIVDYENDTAWIKQIAEWRPNPKFTEVQVVQALNADRLRGIIGENRPPQTQLIYVDDFSNLSHNQREWLMQKGIVVCSADIKEYDHLPHLIDGVSSVIINMLHHSGAEQLLLQQIRNIYGVSNAIPEELLVLEGYKFLTENMPAIVDSTILRFGKSGVALVTGLYRLKHFADTGYFSVAANITPPLKQRLDYAFTNLLHFVKKLHEGGTMLCLGGNLPFNGAAILSEQKILAESGFTVAEVSQMSSMNIAKTLKIDAHKGRIASGYSADLVILEKSPAGSPVSFNQIQRVIKSGRVEKMKK